MGEGKRRGTGRRGRQGGRRGEDSAHRASPSPPLLLRRLAHGLPAMIRSFQPLRLPTPLPSALPSPLPVRLFCTFPVPSPHHLHPAARHHRCSVAPRVLNSPTQPNPTQPNPAVQFINPTAAPPLAAHPTWHSSAGSGSGRASWGCAPSYRSWRSGCGGAGEWGVGGRRGASAEGADSGWCFKIATPGLLSAEG